MMNPEILLCIYLRRKNVDYIRAPFDESTTIFSFSTAKNAGIQGIAVYNKSSKYKVYMQNLEFETDNLDSLNPYFIQKFTLPELPVFKNYSTI